MSEYMKRHGPELWRELHLRALKPLNDIAAEREWLKAFADRIPCGPCKYGWLGMLKIAPPDFSNYFKWTVDRHNTVSRFLGKPQVTLNEARSIWKN